QSLTSVLGAHSQLSSLVTLVNTQAPLVSTLNNAKNVTLLAPSNDAVMKFLNSSAGTQAVATPGALTALLQYHVVNGAFKSNAITLTPVFPSTLLTNSSFTNVTGGQVVEFAAGQGGGVTIFSGLRTPSFITTADLTFDGGVIHIIDTVLMIPPTVSVMASTNLTIVNSFTNPTAFASAITSAGLWPTIDTTPNITIFAPTNDALSASSVKNLTSSQLESVLKYHVVPAVEYSSRLSTMNLPTLEGDDVNITVSGTLNSVMVNQANVVVANVIIANGVLHIIDRYRSFLPAKSNSSSNSSGAKTSASTVNASLNMKSSSFAALAFWASLTL
ncbi:FAS1 domain-containing protein, partial [Gymnopilus junonius]